MSGCSSPAHAEERQRHSETDGRLRPSSNTSGRAGIQGWGGPAKGGGYEWFNAGAASAFAECVLHPAERRTNGDGRPGSGEHGIAIDANDNVLDR